MSLFKFMQEKNFLIFDFTGPYTVFAPTDKAFRALLVQLGGPEKAEEKFKESPRLLSGVSCSSLSKNRVVLGSNSIVHPCSDILKPRCLTKI
jgi:hypothetical protein